MPVAEYLEKYLVAPSPSRDYYGIKIIRDQVILYTWKVSHGPHYASPIVKTSRFAEFDQDKIMHNEIQWVFGESMLQHVRNIAENKTTLITLPKYLVNKIIEYLNFKDVVKLSTISRMANELVVPERKFSHLLPDTWCDYVTRVFSQFWKILDSIFNADTVWELLYKRHKMGLVYKDEKEKGSSCGWKRLFKERQMYRPAKERKLRKQPSDHHLVVPRSARTIKKETTSLSTLKADPKKTSTKSHLPETKNSKSFGLKSFHDLSERPNTANQKKSDGGADKCELHVGKNEGPASKMQIEKQDKLGQNIATIFSTKIEESKSRGTTVNRAKNVTRVKNPEVKSSSGDKTSAKSIIETQKNTDTKLKVSLKSNPASARRIECKSASNSGSLNGKPEHEKVTPILSSKSVRKLSARIKNSEESPGDKDPEIVRHSDISIEDLIRESIIGENNLGSEIFDKYIGKSNDSIGEAEKKTVKKHSKSNFVGVKTSSSIFERFSTPRKPVTVVQSREVVPEKKFAVIKSLLGSDKTDFCRSARKPIDPSNCKNQILTKIESSKSLDSKSTRNKSTRQSTLSKKSEIRK